MYGGLNVTLRCKYSDGLIKKLECGENIEHQSENECSLWLNGLNIEVVVKWGFTDKKWTEPKQQDNK